MRPAAPDATLPAWLARSSSSPRSRSLSSAPAGTASTRTAKTPEQIRAYKDSGAYDAALARTCASATSWVEVQLRSGVRRPAVVLDIDETALSNYACLDEVDFDLGGLATCVLALRGEAIPPALAFYRRMRRLEVAVFWITGSPDLVCDTRRRNLAAQGFTGRLAITCRPRNDRRSSVVPYKSGARRRIQRRGYTILANIGGQRSDLRGGVARRAFKLVNPIYLTP